MPPANDESELGPSERLMQRFQLSHEEVAHLTPQERMNRFHALREEWWAALKADPGVYDEWFRRNVKKRAIDWQPPPDEAVEQKE